MSEIKRIETTERSSRIIIHNGIVYIGGTTAKEDRSQGIQGQTKQALARLDKALADAGTDKRYLLSTQIWLKDIAKDFKAMNEVWNAWTAPGASPTRATCQCEMGAPEVLIEIIATAALPG